MSRRQLPLLCLSLLTGCALGDPTPGPANIVQQNGNLCFSAFTPSARDSIESVTVSDKNGVIWTYWEKDLTLQLPANKRCISFGPADITKSGKRLPVGYNALYGVDVGITNQDTGKTNVYGGYFCVRASRDAEITFKILPYENRSKC